MNWKEGRKNCDVTVPFTTDSQPAGLGHPHALTCFPRMEIFTKPMC